MRLALTALTLALVLTTASGQTGAATVEFEDQESDGTHVIVQQVTLSNGGFVVIHDDTYQDDAIGSVVGVSEYLGIGTHDDVQVNITLDMGAMTGNGTDNQTGNSITLVAMPHFDTNDNEEYDFESSGGAEDGPYTDGGVAEVDEASVTIQETQGAQPDDDDEFDDPETDNDTPALGILLTVGMLGVLAAARRRS